MEKLIVLVYSDAIFSLLASIFYPFLLLDISPEGTNDLCFCTWEKFSFLILHPPLTHRSPSHPPKGPIQPPKDPSQPLRTPSHPQRPKPGP